MDEIDLIRKAAARRDWPSDEEAVVRQEQLRWRVMTEIAAEPASSRLRSRMFRGGVKRGVAVAVGLLMLPAGYAIADSTDVFDGDSARVKESILTRDECEKMPELHAPIPGDAPRLSCADLPTELPEGDSGVEAIQAAP